MKKAITSLLITILVMLNVACQVTPEEPVVVKKDSERLVEMSAEDETGVSLSGLHATIPNYEYDYASPDGKLKIHADASVTVPVGTTLPIYRIVKSGFTQKMVKDIFDYLFPPSSEKPTNSINHVSTKADFEKRLIDLKKQQADGSYDKESYSEEDWQRLIDVTEEMLQNAPASADNGPDEYADGTMSLVEIGSISFYELVCMMPDTLDHQFRVFSYDALPSDLDFSEYMGRISTLSYIKKAENPFSGQDEITLDRSSSIPESYTSNLSIGIDEAIALCDDFFTVAGVSATYEVSDATLLKDTDGRYAVKLYYRQVFNGIPSFSCTRSDCGAQDPYSIPWAYEYIYFIVNADGIAEANWSAPAKATEVVNYDAKMLTFDKVVPIFENMMNNVLAPKIEMYSDPIELDCEVSSVKLELVRVREQNVSAGQGLLVPAWVFYGHLTKATLYSTGTVYTYDQIGDSGTSVLGAPYVMMAINAVDGSIISIDKGY